MFLNLNLKQFSSIFSIWIRDFIFHVFYMIFVIVNLLKILIASTFPTNTFWTFGAVSVLACRVKALKDSCSDETFSFADSILERRDRLSVQDIHWLTNGTIQVSSLNGHGLVE